MLLFIWTIFLFESSKMIKLRMKTCFLRISPSSRPFLGTGGSHVKSLLTLIRLFNLSTSPAALPPDRPFHSFVASKSVPRHKIPQSLDREVIKLKKSRLGGYACQSSRSIAHTRGTESSVLPSYLNCLGSSKRRRSRANEENFFGMFVATEVRMTEKKEPRKCVEKVACDRNTLDRNPQYFVHRV